jgi:hypothetical protein
MPRLFNIETVFSYPIRKDSFRMTSGRLHMADPAPDMGFLHVSDPEFPLDRAFFEAVQASANGCYIEMFRDDERPYVYILSWCRDRPMGEICVLNDGRPLRRLYLSTRAAEFAMEEPRDDSACVFASFAGDFLLPDGRVVCAWNVQTSDGRDALWCHVGEEAHGMVVRHWRDLSPWKDELARELADHLDRAERSVARESARKLQEAERQRLRTEKQRSLLADPAIVARRDEILGKRKVGAYMPRFEPSDGSSESGLLVRPWLADSELWPSAGSLPMLPIFQLRINLLPSPARELLGGDDGLLQFFLSGETPAVNVQGTRSDGIASYRTRRVFPQPGRGGFSELPEEVVRQFQAGWTPLAISCWEHVTDAYMLESDNARLFKRIRGLAAEAGISPDAGDFLLPFPLAGDKLLGAPGWAQEPAWPKAGRRKMAFLFQLDMYFGRLPFLISGGGKALLFVDPRSPDHFALIWDFA